MMVREGPGKAALGLNWPIRIRCFYETARDPTQITSK